MSVRLDATAWAQLQAVNAAVNRETRYRTDLELYGKPEVWAVAAGAGDCEDYALEKVRRLRDLGWPETALRLATCTCDGEGHAVLTVDTDAGTYVLDNRYPDPKAWADLPYAWVARQAASGPWWVAIPA